MNNTFGFQRKLVDWILYKESIDCWYLSNRKYNQCVAPPNWDENKSRFSKSGPFFLTFALHLWCRKVQVDMYAQFQFLVNLQLFLFKREKIIVLTASNSRFFMELAPLQSGILSKDVFKTLSNIWDRDFCKSRYFYRKDRFLAWSQIRLSELLGSDELHCFGLLKFFLYFIKFWKTETDEKVSLFSVL